MMEKGDKFEDSPTILTNEEAVEDEKDEEDKKTDL